MEHILGAPLREPLVLRDFLAECQATLKSLPRPVEDNFCPFEAQPSERARRLLNARQRCSLEHLAAEGDAPVTSYEPGVTLELVRINPFCVGQSTRAELRSYKRLAMLRERSSPFAKTADGFKTLRRPPEAGVVAGDDELLLSVRVYRPARATHVGRTIEKPSFAEEFLCLGRNRLSELRDKITCICNRYRFFDVSDEPTAPMRRKLTDPGYFFIGATFYNDRRNPRNADYSKVVRAWAKSDPALEAQELHVADMHTTRFRDLTLSLGCPHLYQHHGNCEHLFVFSQVTILRLNAMNPSRDLYPYARSVSVFNSRVCNLCGVLQFSYIVEESDRHLHDPAYLCHKCFHSFHYVDGKKVGEFKAYRMHDLYMEEGGAQGEGEVTEA